MCTWLAVPEKKQKATVRSLWTELTGQVEANPIHTLIKVDRELKPGAAHALSERCGKASRGELPHELTETEIDEILETPDERTETFAPSDLVRVELNDWQPNDKGAGLMIPGELHGKAHRLFVWARHRVPPGMKPRTSAPVFVLHSEVVAELCPGDDAAKAAASLYAFAMSPEGGITPFGEPNPALETLIRRAIGNLPEPKEWDFTG